MALPTGLDGAGAGLGLADMPPPATPNQVQTSNGVDYAAPREAFAGNGLGQIPLDPMLAEGFSGRPTHHRQSSSMSRSDSASLSGSGWTSQMPAKDPVPQQPSQHSPPPPTTTPKWQGGSSVLPSPNLNHTRAKGRRLSHATQLSAGGAEDIEAGPARKRAKRGEARGAVNGVRRTTGEIGTPVQGGVMGEGSSVMGTPAMGGTATLEDQLMIEDTEEWPMVRCGWNDCQQAFWVLDEMLDHLIGPNGHLSPSAAPNHGTGWACEWAGCPKEGKRQGSRQQVIVHLRSHTGEKPFGCHRPECDKTFSRTDALAKHVRVSHDEVLPPSRRLPRKKGKGKLEDVDEDEGDVADYAEGLEGSPPSPAQPDPKEVKEEGRTAEEQAVFDDLQRRFPGQDTHFLEYVVLLAKYKFASGERDRLRDEFAEVTAIEAVLQVERDTAFDDWMAKHLGPDSAPFSRAAIDAITIEEDWATAQGLPPLSP